MVPSSEEKDAVVLEVEGQSGRGVGLGQCKRGPSHPAHTIDCRHSAIMELNKPGQVGLTSFIQPIGLSASAY